MISLRSLLSVVLGVCVVVPVMAAKIAYIIKPLNNYIFNLPYNGVQQVLYQVTNNSPKRATLAIEPITGVAQLSTIQGACTIPFTLEKGQSCTLQLQITGNQLKLPIMQGPVVCDTIPDTANPSPFSCSRPSKNESLHVTVGPEENPTISVTNTPLTLIPNGSAGNLTVTNNSMSVTARNITSSFENTGLQGKVQLTNNTCETLAPQSSCNLTYTPSSNQVTLTSFPIAGANTNTLTAQISNTYFAYIVNENGDVPVSKCLINPDTQTLSDCNTAEATVISTPYSIVLNNNHTTAYITSSQTNSVTMCDISNIDGQFSNCQDSGAGNIFTDATGITLNSSNLHAYVSGNHSINKCDIAGNGTFSNCQNTYVSADSLHSLALNPDNTYIYIGTNDQSIYQCSVSGIDGSLSNCSSATNSIYFNAPWGITLNNAGTLAFSANTGNYLSAPGSISICSINAFSHLFSSCNTYLDLLNFSFPASITLNSDGTKAYISNKNNNTVSLCNVDQLSSPPTINSCIDAAANSLSSPVALSIL